MDSQPDRTNSVEQQLQDQLLAGVQGNVKQQGKIRDQLREMFNPDEYVTIANPFEHVTGWAYVDPSKLNERPDKTTKRTTFGKPKTRILQPGQQVVIHGWEAYIALGRMFKEYAQSQGGNMIIVLTSQKEIEAFLRKAYKGVFDPNSQIDAINSEAAAQDIAANTPAPVVPTADPLGFDAPEPTTPAPQQEQVFTQPAPSNIGVDVAQQGGDTTVLDNATEDELLAQGVSQEQIDQQIEQNGTTTPPQA